MGTISKAVINGKEYNQKVLKDLIEYNDQAAIRALVIVFNNQTDHEQYVGHNSELNGVGFTRNDVNCLTPIAHWLYNKAMANGLDLHRYKKSMQIQTCWLKDWQIEKLHWKMPKYWRQVLKHMVLAEQTKGDK